MRSGEVKKIGKKKALCIKDGEYFIDARKCATYQEAKDYIESVGGTFPTKEQIEEYIPIEYLKNKLFWVESDDSPKAYCHGMVKSFPGVYNFDIFYVMKE